MIILHIRLVTVEQNLVEWSISELAVENIGLELINRDEQAALHPNICEIAMVHVVDQ